LNVDLSDLGWDEEREEQFTEHHKNGLLPARVTESTHLFYKLMSEKGEISGKLSGKFRYMCRSKGDFPTVGDWIGYKPSKNKGFVQIQVILERKSAFSRKVAGKESDEQVIAANIDMIVIVNGLDKDFSVRRIERYVTLAGESGADFVIVLNKADLCEDLDSVLASIRELFGDVPVHAISALDDRGLDPIRELFVPGRTHVLLGSSGVGKSTIINRLLGEDRIRTSSVSDYDGRGRHTTTSKNLILLPNSAIVIDTPGLREIQLLATGVGLAHAFADIEEFSRGCRFRDCTHTSEPGCAVLAAVEDGTVSQERLDSYHKLKREIDYNLTKSEDRFSNKRSPFWKKVSKLSREIQKNNRKHAR